MSKRNAIHQGFDRFGSKAGFEKKSGSWYRSTPEVIAICNLQKSQYGPRYFFNLSFWLRELGDERYPKAHQSHVVARAEDLVPQLEPRLNELLDLEYPISDEVRIFELVAVVNENVLPLVERAKDVAGLLGLVADGTFKRALIAAPAHEMLGVGYPEIDEKGSGANRTEYVSPDVTATRIGTYEENLSRVGDYLSYWWRVTRYDPANRDFRGAYKVETWTSISDIGKEFDGHVLTFDEYSAVEDAYLDAFVRFASAGEIEQVQVVGLEHGAELREGQLLSIEDARQVVREILREEAWCRLEAVDGSFALHAGYDYYMFIGSDMPSEEAVEAAVESGLFVEPDFVSPYIPKEE